MNSVVGRTGAPGDGVVARLVRERAVAALGRFTRVGTMTLHWPDGTWSRIEGAFSGPAASIEIRRWRALRRLALGGGSGAADAYADGDWDTPDLTAVIELLARNRALAGDPPRPAAAVRAARRLVHAARGNSRAGSRRNIAFHYDMGNAFFGAWLDPSMTYSGAVFAPGADDLAAAQRAKYRRLVDLLDARPGDRVLEIGCGWGGFALYAAQEHGLRVTALTISREQHAFARRRVKEAGLSERVDVVLCDYRDARGAYDHVVSIEMFEAVGERYWPVFFDRMAACLRPGGRAAMQVITIDDALFDSYRRGVDFIQSRIFPGGMLPSPSALRHQATAAGLVWRGTRGFGLDYARTLAHWHGRFQAVWPELSAMGYDERFRRLWSFYLCYCEGGFRAGNVDVQQVALTRP